MIEIKNGDSLQLMKELKDESIDLIVTDPPYFRVMIREYNGKMHDWDNQWESFEDYLNWCRTWFNELNRVLKVNGSLYVFADDKISAYIQVELDKLFNLKNNIVWVKPNNMPIKGWRSYHCYAPITERILFYSKDLKKNEYKGCFTPKRNFTDVWTFPITSSSEDTYHPTQKPISILNRIIQTSSRKGDTVLDPFMGSGTTGVASVAFRRNFIGYELDEKYFKIAKDRIENTNIILNDAGTNGLQEFEVVE